MKTRQYYILKRFGMNGFTMVELMVAVLVLAIGLLGLAGLQVWGLNNNHNAYLRTQATLLAQDIIERMRSNSNLDAYLGSGTADDCFAHTCDSGQMAGYDLTRWNSALATQLPGGTGTVTKTQGPPVVYNITITWVEQESNPNTPGSNRQVTKNFSTSFQP